jgi:predicted transcriptional regulator
MATPPSSKTVRVSTETHQRLTALAERHNGTVDDVISRLLAPDLVMIRASAVQRERWQIQATASGMPLAEFIAACTESAVQYGLDRGAMVLQSQHIREILALVKRAAQK